MEKEPRPLFVGQVIVPKESAYALPLFGVGTVCYPVPVEEDRCLCRLRRPGEASAGRASLGSCLLQSDTSRSARHAVSPTTPARRARAAFRYQAACRRWYSPVSPAWSSCSRAYSRSVSSMKKRSSPSGLSRLWSSSAATWSRSAPVIASAASRVKEPRKTESRRNAICASWSSRSWLHSIVARRVRCRSGRSPAPPVSRGSAASRRLQ